jgi:ABC-2 type transport system permease protein
MDAAHQRADLPTLRTIPGPTAASGDRRRFWRLVWHLAKTDFVLKYQGSAFGYLWSLLNPLMLFGVLYLVFTKVFRLGDSVPHYAALLLLNVMLFQFFADTTSRCVTSIVGAEGLIRKMEFPRLAIPLSIILAGTFTLALDLIVVLGYMLVSGVPVMTTWLLLPVLMVWLYIFTIGASLLLSTLYVFFRDIAQIWLVVSRVMFYASPVLLPIELFPPGWRKVLLINPLAPLFAQTRVWLVDANAPTFAQALGGEVFWIIPTVVLLGIFVLGAWVFDREAPRVAEQI